MDFGTGSISGSQLSDLQKEALKYENTVRNGGGEMAFMAVTNCYGTSYGAKLFKSASDSIVNEVRNAINSAWDNTIHRSLENIWGSICELLHIDYAEIDPNGPVAKFLYYIDSRLKKNEILSAITGVFEWPCDVIEFAAELLTEGKSTENLLKFLELLMPVPILWDIVPQGSSGATSQGGKYRIETGY